MKKPTILRKRYIPDETVDISNDEMLYRDKNILITRWKTIKPRPDISVGVSFTFLKEGYKISRFYDHKKNFLFWYCDIIDVSYDEKNDTYLLVDLLLDMKVMPDGTVEVIDEEELAEALAEGLITKEQSITALKRLNTMIEMTECGDFPPGICNKEEYWRV